VSSRRGTVVAPNSKPLDSGLINVEALTLDAYAADHDPPTMIKIDVEGAEIEVLKGAQRLISRTRPVLLFEVHHRQTATFLQDQLCQNDYKMESLAGYPNFAFPRHLLARPSEWCYK
jgi:hypothetical protein